MPEDSGSSYNSLVLASEGNVLVRLKPENLSFISFQAKGLNCSPREFTIFWKPCQLSSKDLLEIQIILTFLLPEGIIFYIWVK